ncbi:hypothetical protein GM415_12505 [Pseudodesulfovibrio cashew]|uniref:GIY-YIG domain-containing protein n=1 Tax=Pseudodesulfovibrio cashew TaxID=2678688 RepID=A0A6I6JDK9_9BACT|nr:hypothetical protein [Pseudodesulfovibrio cashew]QGY40916.1 hypothetical protein GM415_12505 [Pseudodesulfovibrio cashew]
MSNKKRQIDNLIFSGIPLKFSKEIFSDVFSRKNNSTLGKTLQAKRYKKIAELENFSNLSQEELNAPLGEFLMNLKNDGDNSYTLFLNDYGDLEYTSFAIVDKEFHNKKGVYAYFVGDEVKYIGRCTDNMRTRVNNGYGRIAPKNCYKDGQSTNCRINNLVRLATSNVTLWLHEMEDREIICQKEQELIELLSPPWNIKK